MGNRLSIQLGFRPVFPCWLCDTYKRDSYGEHTWGEGFTKNPCIHVALLMVRIPGPSKLMWPIFEDGLALESLTTLLLNLSLSYVACAVVCRGSLGRRLRREFVQFPMRACRPPGSLLSSAATHLWGAQQGSIVQKALAVRLEV